MSIILKLVIALIVIPIVLRLAALAIGKHALAQQPDRIRLHRRDARVWHNPQTVETLARALAWKGFQDAGIYTVDEMPAVRLQLFADIDRSILGIVYEHSQAGQWVELVTRYEDGTSASFSTLRPTGLNLRPGHMTVNAPGLDPAALLARLVAERPRQPMKPVSAADAQGTFEEGYADQMAWRKQQGVSASEVAKVAAERKAA